MNREVTTGGQDNVEVQASEQLDLLTRELGVFPSRTVYLPVSALNYDRDNYQRVPNKPKIAKMTANWDPIGVGTITVSKRADGSYWCVDGQNRSLTAGQKFGVDYLIKADLFEGLTIPQESRMFFIINSERGPVQPAKRYRSAYLGGDSEVCQVIGILDALDIGYSWEGAGGDRVVVCFVALHQIAKKMGAERLRDTLQLIDDAWDSDHTALQGFFIAGVSLLFRYHVHDNVWKYDEVVTALKRTESVDIVSSSKDFRRALTVEKVSPPYAIYRALHRAINKGRRTRKLARPHGGDE